MSIKIRHFISMLILALSFFNIEKSYAQCSPDIDPPVLSGIPVNVTVSTCTVPSTAPTVTDNCTANITPVFSDMGTISACGGGTITRTWKATDAANNTGFFTQTIVVSPDNIAPVFSPGATDLLLDCNPATSASLISTWLAARGNAVATDCSTITWSYSPTTPTPVSGCIGSAGGITVTFTAKDACNNVATTAAKIISTDNFSPVLTQQAVNKVVACSDFANELSTWLSNNGGAAATDACTAPNDIDVIYSVNGTSVNTTQLGSYFLDSLALGCKDNVLIGSTTYNKVAAKMKVTFVFKDKCGNLSAPTSATFAATDNAAPTFSTAAANKTAQCDTITNLVNSVSNWYNARAGAVASDDCAATVSYRTVPPTLADVLAALATSQGVSCGNTGSVTVSFFAKDPCGNESAASSATFLIEDKTAPKFTTLPASTTINCMTVGGSNTAALQTFINTHAGGVATDVCSTVAPTWSFTWKDKLNNVGSNTYPTIPSSGAGYPSCDWYADITFKVKDECNNSDTIKVRFAIQDQTPPTLTNLQPDVTVTCTTIPSMTSDFPGASDNCGYSLVSLISTISNQNNNCNGTYQIKKTWYATDQCGNKSTYTRTITVMDSDPPVISNVPADATVACDAVPPIPKVVISDGCDSKPDSIYSEVSTKGTDSKLCSFYNYTLTRKWQSKDKCGNISSKSYTLTVKDTAKPSFTVPSDLTIECFQLTNSGVTGKPTLVSDNCDAQPKVDSVDVVTAGSCIGNNTITRTWKATDACNNFFTKNQTIVTRDTRKPVLVGVPADITLECGTPLPALPSITVKDSCDLSIVAAFVGSVVPTTCSGTNTVKREWTATDNCGNKSTKTQNITFIDSKKPQIVVCPSDFTINNSFTTCDANVPLLAPVVTDDCGNVTSSYSQLQTTAVGSNTPGDPNVIVNPVVLNFTVPLNQTTTASNVSFNILLKNVDAEDAAEYFNIVGENSTSLGKTNPSAMQCSNSTTIVTLTAAQVNAWGQDGTISITLNPNVPVGNPPIYGINDICGNASVEAILAFTSNSNTGLTYQYNVDNGAKTTINPIGNTTQVMSVGTHTVKYFVKDCSNNVDSCEYKVKVLDTEAPNMDAPSDQTYYIVGTNCTVTKTLPTPTTIYDNCGFGTGYTQKQPKTAGDSLLTFVYNPNLLTYFAADKIFTFTGVTSNLVNSNAVISVNLKADAESAGEYYTFLGEDNIPLGSTNNLQTCSVAGLTNIKIPAAKFNAWAADGQIVVKAISNTSFPISQAGTGQGINPCSNTVTTNGQNDGSSFMTATLSYNTANPIYSTTGATVTPPTPFFQPNVVPQLTFNIGVTYVKYELSDAAGNKTTVNFEVDVVDNTPPVAKCKNSVLYVSPAAVGTVAISTSTVNDGSYDNCGIQFINITPTAFNCGDIGSEKTVTLTVADLGGNTSTCMAQVYLDVEKPKVTYSLGICGNDSLKLFASPPNNNFGTAFQYSWSGPNNFSSTAQNPIIPNVKPINSGTYKVSIYPLLSGACYYASTEIQIPIDNQPNTPTIVSPNVKPCTNGELVLNTAAYTGKKVKYYWYKGISPSGSLVDSTTVPSYSILNPATGAAKYYVIVKVDGCTSNASASITVNPETPPSAALTNAPIIEICEGENITLGTSTVGAGFKYQWSGPNGMTSTSQYPNVIVGAKPLNSGTYTLIVTSANGCESAPMQTSVNVKPKPKTPSIVANGLDCEGSSVNLLSNIIGAGIYHWVKPDLVSEQVTTTNTLTLNPLSAVMKGQWKLYVTNNNCNSELSNIVDLKVNGKPSVTADFQNPACEGATLNLTGSAPANSSFTWSGPNNFTSNVQNPTTPSLAGTYILTAIDQNGCSNFDDVVVALKPKPDITAISSDAQPCVTGTADIKLTPTVFPFDPNHAYQWTGANVSSNAKILTLPNATSTVNGTYILQVISEFGCKSTPKSYVVDVRNVPQTPVIKGSITQNACVGDNILLELDNANVYIGAAISYKWTTPTGVITTTQPTLSIPSSVTANSGDYSLKVQVDGCESALSGIKKITVYSIPGKPIITGNTPLCEGETLQLSTPVINNATYMWLGPNNFTASVSNPTKPNVTKDDQGFYKVKVVVNGCPSVFSDNFFVTVNETPKPVPVIKNSGPVCLDAPNPNLTLSIEGATAIPGATYAWYNAKTGALLATPSSSLNFSVPSFTGYTEGIQEFYAITTFNGCSTKPSIPTAVIMNKIPADKAFAGADIQVCDAQAVSLAAQKPSIGTGLWEQVAGSSITVADPTLNTTKISSLVPGQSYIMQWKLSNGACKDYSFDEVKIQVNDTSVKADAGDSIQVCNKNQINLNATALATGVTGVWTQSIAQSQLGVVIMNPNSPTAIVKGLSNGNMYTFKWTISNAACKDYSFDEVYVMVDGPKGVAFAGVDVKTCGNNALNLAASPVIGTVGKWTSLGAAQIVSPSSPTSAVKNLTIGANKFVWAISTMTCGTYSRDTVIVSYEGAAQATADNVAVPYAGSTTFAPMANDIIPPSGFTFAITKKPRHGTTTVSTDNKITYKAENAYAGPDDMEYELCNSTCPDVCSTGKIFITITGGNDCTIPTIITPNDDQINDRWEIPCLVGTDFPGNSVTIYNQWGDVVFSKSNYTNDWEGTYNGQKLPAATYFYIVKFGTTDTKSGFLIIEH
jgi:gliding motility-associated-like protein